MTALNLYTPVASVVSAEQAALLAEQLSITTVGELMRHLPFRLQDGAVRDHSAAQKQYARGDRPTVFVRGRITAIEEFTSPRTRRKGLNVRLESDSGMYRVSFFRPVWTLKPGMNVVMAGEYSEYRGQRQISQPQWAILPAAADAENYIAIKQSASKLFVGVNLGLVTRRLTPVYHGTAKLSSLVIMTLIDDVLRQLPAIAEPAPAEFVAEHRLLSFDAAVRELHHPSDEKLWRAAHSRIAYDEAIALQLAIARRARTNEKDAAPRLAAAEHPRENELLSRLPFELTDGQKAVLAEITADIDRDFPMSRLLQGEVGSGKTLVALIAMLRAVDAGYQAVILAPTEVLASQHYRSISAMLGPLGKFGQLDGADNATAITLLTGSMPTRARRAALLQIVTGEAGIIIGTHALLEDTVEFYKLGLLVVDEQHRFGVQQRERLRRKSPDGQSPHVLAMTATPIPRTVAMTVFGDMDTSSLRELPRGRQAISTSVVPLGKPAWVARVWERVGEEVAAGRQVYVVCPRIGDDGKEAKSGVKIRGGDEFDFEDVAAGPPPRDTPAADDTNTEPPDEQPTVSAVDMYAQLTSGPLKDLRIALIHGRQHPDERGAVMDGFNSGDIDILVSTTVIEVGVDVANATTMVIMNADRFGISQLHQLRGRVGRGGLPGLCLLCSSATSESTTQRLHDVAASTDGYALAELDLQRRGYGDLLGVLQAGRDTQGLTSLDISNPLHQKIVSAARVLVDEILDDDPDLVRHEALRDVAGVILGASRESFLDML